MDESTMARKVVFAGFFVALGVVLPFAFHMVGGGQTFLPMHIPVFLAALYMGPLVGGTVGLLSPILSHLLTGMPPLAPIPMVVIMTFELFSYGVVTGWVYALTAHLYKSLLAGMVMGRVTAGMIVWGLIHILGFQQMVGPLPFLIGGIITGLPGIAIQLVLIPLLVLRTQHRISGEVKNAS